MMLGAIPHPAWACSCLAQSDDQYFSAATIVFIGSPLEAADGDPIVWTFAVESVTKGVASSPLQIFVARSQLEGCGFTFEVGARYQVFASDLGGDLYTGTCSGDRELSQGRTPYEPGHTPATSPTGGGSFSGPTEAPPHLPGTPQGGAAPSSEKGGKGGVGAELILIGIAAIAALGLAVWAASNRRRRQAS